MKNENNRFVVTEKIQFIADNCDHYELFINALSDFFCRGCNTCFFALLLDSFVKKIKNNKLQAYFSEPKKPYEELEEETIEILEYCNSKEYKEREYYKIGDKFKHDVSGNVYMLCIDRGEEVYDFLNLICVSGNDNAPLGEFLLVEGIGVRNFNKITQKEFSNMINGEGKFEKILDKQ